MTCPRSEYPRPQFMRRDWLNLNGEWEFEMDHGDSGFARGLTRRSLERRIVVPFCPESTLSGIGHTDRMLAVWYRRTVMIPAEWAGKDVHLHFGAVDYDATVWVNGTEVKRHRGGFTSFTCDLRGVVAAGHEAVIVVRARDDWRDSKPRGKQAQRVANHDCLYTRTTGIWQTVWMEPVPRTHLKRARITPDVANSRFRIEQPLSSNGEGFIVRAALRDEQGVVSTAVVAADIDLAPHFDLTIPESRWRLWSPADPHLYHIDIELINARDLIVDRIESYAGLRAIAIEGKAIKLNGERVFQRLVLDQGYYPDGLMTAPSDEALVYDIELAQAAGFNGARLHQKVFEERFLYHADRLGYLCWGEFGDWSHGYIETHDYEHVSATFITQWHEAIERDYSHPAIIGWCPTNELIEKLDDRITELDDLVRGMFLATKALDQTRPVLDISGFRTACPRATSTIRTITSRTSPPSMPTTPALPRISRTCGSYAPPPTAARWCRRPRYHMVIAVSPTSSASLAACCGIRSPRPRNTRGATASARRHWRSFTAASRVWWACCSRTRTCSGIATPSSPTFSKSRTASTTLIGVRNSTWRASAPRSAAWPRSRLKAAAQTPRRTRRVPRDYWRWRRWAWVADNPTYAGGNRAHSRRTRP
jgi:beta-galactosidase/beta-glucuronidase